MRNRTILLRLVLLLFVFCSSAGVTVRAQEEDQDRRSLAREEALDYYRKWLEEDVVYIITAEERSVFEKLTTPEEKEQFIEQFWFRRDPDPKTAANEFKEEHYRRIAYANELYFAGKPGWRTDRGRIYILYGPPAEIQSHPSGGMYERELSEGGGRTYNYPFEVWRYRQIEGIGDDVILEFVDSQFTGEYRLSHMPEDKDALLYIDAPSAGPTIAEMEGRAQRRDRPVFSPGTRDLYPDVIRSYRDNPFYRYEVYSKVHTPPAIKYKDLQQLVKVNVEFVNLPFTVRQDYFRLNDQQILVPVTLQIENKDLTFELQSGRHSARVAVYGIITGINNRVAEEFEDDLVISYRPEDLESGLQQLSLYQKVVPLDRRIRYKVDLVVKDLGSGHTGVIRQAIVPPPFQDGKLTASSLILSDYLEVLDEVPDSDEMFVLGDVKVRPNLNKVFPPGQNLGVYFQVYSAGIDQSTLTPALTVTYRLRKGDGILQEIVDNSGESIQYYSTQRIVLVKVFELGDLGPGDYQIEVDVRDELLDQYLQTVEPFKIGVTG